MAPGLGVAVFGGGLGAGSFFGADVGDKLRRILFGLFATWGGIFSLDLAALMVSGAGASCFLTAGASCFLTAGANLVLEAVTGFFIGVFVSLTSALGLLPVIGNFPMVPGLVFVAPCFSFAAGSPVLGGALSPSTSDAFPAFVGVFVTLPAGTWVTFCCLPSTLLGLSFYVNKTFFFPVSNANLSCSSGRKFLGSSIG